MAEETRREKLVQEMRERKQEIEQDHARLKAEILSEYATLNLEARATADHILKELASADTFTETLYQGILNGSMPLDEAERWLEADLREAEQWWRTRPKPGVE
jgi:hypothetical protein